VPRARSQRDHDLAVDAPPGLQRDGIADLLDRENRGDGNGELAGQDRIGDARQGIRRCVDAAGGANATGRGGARGGSERWCDSVGGDDDFSDVARRALGEVQAASAEVFTPVELYRLGMAD
jgi:hypothetical protein